MAAIKRRTLMLLRQGDISDAICPTCKAWSETRIEYRTFGLTQSKIDGPDVLVGVCQTCDDVASIPQQSAPKLREARQSTPSRIDARISKELRDVIGMMANEFCDSPEPFAGGMLRYYLAVIAGDSVLAKRIGKLANSEIAAGTPGGRIAFRLERPLIDSAMAKVNAKSDVVDQSGLIRGIVIAARQDSIERPMDKRVVALRAIALAMG